MSKRMNLESGFLFLYDWLPVLEGLSGKEFKALFLALVARQRDGTPLPPFRNATTALYARMIEPCIARRLHAAHARKLAHQGDADGTESSTGTSTGVSTFSAPCQREEEKRKEKKSIADGSEATAPEGGVYATAKGGGGATARADTQKKEFYGYKKGGRSSYGSKKRTTWDTSMPSSFDIDEFFEAALARTYGPGGLCETLFGNEKKDADAAQPATGAAPTDDASGVAYQGDFVEKADEV